jgi:hypothetical protein
MHHTYTYVCYLPDQHATAIFWCHLIACMSSTTYILASTEVAIYGEPIQKDNMLHAGGTGSCNQSIHNNDMLAFCNI